MCVFSVPCLGLVYLPSDWPETFLSDVKIISTKTRLKRVYFLFVCVMICLSTALSDTFETTMDGIVQPTCAIKEPNNRLSVFVCFSVGLF